MRYNYILGLSHQEPAPLTHSLVGSIICRCRKLTMKGMLINE